jgi:hypothetical protein
LFSDSIIFPNHLWITINMSLPSGECCMRGWKQRTRQQTASESPSNWHTVMLSFCFMFCMKHIRRSTSCLITWSMKYFISS